MTAAATSETAATERPPTALVLGLSALLAVRLMVAASAGLTDDEAYYRLWSLKLQAGYYDHAPMVAWAIRAGRDLVGDTALGLRLFSPVAGFVGSLLLWRTVALIDGPRLATRTVVWFNAVVLVAAGTVLMTPDTPSVFFWGATLWALAELTASRDPRWWLAVGLAAGLGLFSKYSVLFLGLGILLWLVASKETRIWLRSRQLWAGGAIAVALFLPVVAWNADHHWISFAKQFGRTVPHGLRPEKLLEFLGVQWLLIGLPLAPLCVLGLVRTAGVWRAGEAGGGRAGVAGAILPLATSLPFLAYLLFHSIHGGIEGNWPAPLDAALVWMAARAVPFATSADAAHRDFVARTARLVAPLGFGLSALLYLHAVTPLVVLPPEKDPTAQMRGWDDFAADIEVLRTKTGAAWIAVPSYTLAGQFTARLGTARVVQLGEPERYAHLAPPDPAMLAAPALYVARTRRDPIDHFRDRFATVESLGTVDRTIRGEVVDTYALWRLTGARGDPRR